MGTLFYLLFALVALVGPGLARQRLAGVRLDPSLVLPVGTAVTAALFWASLVTRISWIFPVVVLALVASLAWRPSTGTAPGPGLRGALLPFLVLVALLAAT